MNNNAIPIPNVNMSMGGFPSGLNMGLPNNGLNPFNMKLTPQQLNSFVSSGVGMPGIFPQQTAGIPTGMAQPQNNAFMLPNNNMAFGVGGPNQMVHTNPLAFGGIPSGMLPHGMLPGMMNQPPPQLQSNATQPVVGNVPNPFNQPVHGLRPGGRNQAGGNLNQPYLGLTNIPNSNILHDPNSLHAGVQQNPQLHNGTTGRQNFHQDVDRNLPNRNDASKALGSQFRQNPTSTVEQNRDRGMNQNQNRERMLMDRERDRERDRQPVAEKVSSMGRRRSDSAERRHTVTRPSDRLLFTIFKVKSVTGKLTSNFLGVREVGAEAEMLSGLDVTERGVVHAVAADLAKIQWIVRPRAVDVTQLGVTAGNDLQQAMMPEMFQGMSRILSLMKQRALVPEVLV